MQGLLNSSGEAGQSRNRGLTVVNYAVEVWVRTQRRIIGKPTCHHHAPYRGSWVCIPKYIAIPILSIKQFKLYTTLL